VTCDGRSVCAGAGNSEGSPANNSRQTNWRYRQTMGGRRPHNLWLSDIGTKRPTLLSTRISTFHSQFHIHNIQSAQTFIQTPKSPNVCRQLTTSNLKGWGHSSHTDHWWYLKTVKWHFSHVLEISARLLAGDGRRRSRSIYSMLWSVYYAVGLGPWPIRSLELSLPGLFAPGNELKVLWNFRSVEFSFLGTFTPLMCISPFAYIDRNVLN